VGREVLLQGIGVGGVVLLLLKRIKILNWDLDCLIPYQLDTVIVILVVLAAAVAFLVGF
jgi:hypothetical protein